MEVGGGVGEGRGLGLGVGVPVCVGVTVAVASGVGVSGNSEPQATIKAGTSTPSIRARANCLRSGLPCSIEHPLRR